MSAATATTGLALRLLARDWRAGELRLLVLALVVAVASVTAVGFFTERVERALERQAGELLAADLVVASRAPIPDAWRAGARERGLQVTTTLTFPSMVSAGERLQLAEVKAVGPGYPLRGRLTVAPEPFAPESPAEGIPARGQVWLDPRLHGALAITPESVVNVGRSEMAVGPVLAFEPDRGGDLFSIAPRLLMHLDDIPATGLVGEGSRVRHRLLVAGPGAAVEAYRQWLAPRLNDRASLQGLDEARPEMRQAMERARRFLALAALTSVVLCGVAVAVAAGRYANRHLDTVAVAKCLGASQRQVTGLVLIQLLGVGLLAGLAGAAVGFGAQFGVAAILAPLLPGALPPPTATPALAGVATAVVTLLGFALPPLAGLRRVPPLRVLRRDLGAQPMPVRWAYALALAAVAGLALWQVQEPRLAAYLLAGLVAGGLVLAGAGGLLLRALAPLRHRGAVWRFGVAAVVRRGPASVTQVVAFGIAALVLLLLTVVRGDLLAGWQESLPPDTPNVFLINVQPGEVEAMTGFLRGAGVERAELYPMVRGRLVSIAGRPVGAEDYDSPRARRLVEREFNLSWAEEPQSDNRIVAGRWWSGPDPDPGSISVEEGIAETLGIALGDTLRFQVAGESVTGEVTNLRSVQWDSFNVNFFVVFPPGALEDMPATWITSFHLPGTDRGLLTELVQRFPSVTVLDVDALLARVRGIMEQAVLAVEYVFAFTLAAGFLVFAAAVQATLDERRLEGAVMRTLGGHRRQLALALATEFGILGAMAGLLGAAGAVAVGWVLATLVLELPYQPALWLPLAGAAGGALALGLAGTLAARPVLNHPPVASLRSG